MLKLT